MVLPCKRSPCPQSELDAPRIITDHSPHPCLELSDQLQLTLNYCLTLPQTLAQTAGPLRTPRKRQQRCRGIATHLYTSASAQETATVPPPKYRLPASSGIEMRRTSSAPRPVG